LRVGYPKLELRFCICKSAIFSFTLAGGLLTGSSAGGIPVAKAVGKSYLRFKFR
jgi:hypothetical protein